MTVDVLFPFSVMDKQEPIFAPLGVGSDCLEKLPLPLSFFGLQLTTLDAQALEKTVDFPGLEREGQGYSILWNWIKSLDC